MSLATRFFTAFCCLIFWAMPAAADEALDVLVAAYPAHLAAHDNQYLVWKDGARQRLSDGQPNKSFDDLLNHPSLVDQLAIPYPLGLQTALPAVNEDPGRIRNEEFFQKMYGDCRKDEVAGQLRPVAWLPHRGGGTIMATRVNGVADRLEKISAELEKLPPAITKYAAPSAGIYKCRTIAGSNQVSMHSYGAAIDLNDKFGDYWLWNQKKDGGALIRHHRIPQEIVDIFERFGFIWGGKWYHFDTFHFEYRPELINLARKHASRN